MLGSVRDKVVVEWCKWRGENTTWYGGFGGVVVWLRKRKKAGVVLFWWFDRVNTRGGWA